MLVGRGIGGGISVPAGLIVPYAASGAAPSGWTKFSSADGKHIRGAQNGTLAIGATTTGAVAAAGTTSTNGAHVGTLGGSIAGAGPTYHYQYEFLSSSQGGHSHTFTGSGTASDVYKDFQLIKADTARPFLPANALLLANSSLSNLTQYESSTDRFLRANSSYGSTGGSSTLSLTSGSYNTAGAHDHNDGQLGSWNDGGANRSLGVANGGHSNHSGTLTGTMNTKYFYLTAWGNASASFPLYTNGIAMYESFTPPAGWVLCDGTNGTPDLRQFFIRIGSVAQMGNSGGNNIITTCSGSAGTINAHAHFSAASYPSTITWTGYHTTNSGHGHTLTCSNVSCISPSYALAFIMKD